MTDVRKSEIYPVFGCEICFVAIYAIFGVICFVAIYALLCGQKLYRWRKNDKYVVCKILLAIVVKLKVPFDQQRGAHIKHRKKLLAMTEGSPAIRKCHKSMDTILYSG